MHGDGAARSSRRSGRRRVATAIGVGYVLGMLPTADLVRRSLGRGVDLRSAGTGNPGAANALAVLGRRAGAMVMAGDIAKGAVACVAGGAIAGPVGAHAAGTAAVVGHCWPVWNGFRGGKGVAASVGQCLVTFPAYFPIDIAVAFVSASNPRRQRRAATSTTIASICWVLGGVAWWRRGWPNLWGPRPTAALPLASAVSSAVIVHRFALAARRSP